MPRRLREAVRAWRIGDPGGQFPVWSAEGARRVSGRWHEAGSGVIYASESYPTAMLEKLVHWNGVLPPNQHFIEINIPPGASCELVTPDAVPGWDDADGEAARRFGRTWYGEGRSALLFVPSVVVRTERNIIINARHADFKGLTVGPETPVWWDQRLFRRP